MSLLTILSFCAIGLIAVYMGNKIYEIPIFCIKKVPPYVYWVLIGAVILTASELKSILFGFFIYLFLFFVVYDLLFLLIKRINSKAAGFLKACYMNGLLIFFLSVLITVYGFYHSKDTVVKEYSVTVEKQHVGLEELKIVMVSDLHMGTSIGGDELTRIVDTINDMDADLICLVGDIVDENTSHALMESTYRELGKLTSRYGTYYVIGNHELYTSFDYTEITRSFEKEGIIALLDESVLVDDSFYIVGRLDYDYNSKEHHRESLDELLADVNTDYPIILLDHQPQDYENAKEAGVDLLLSGHTHNGQLYPGNYLVMLGNESAYGYEQENDFHAIVSSGVGTWGFAMRVGSESEIVTIDMKINNVELANERMNKEGEEVIK